MTIKNEKSDDEDYVNLAARVPTSLRRRARMIALKEGRTIQEVLREVIEKWVKEQEEKGDE